MIFACAFSFVNFDKKETEAYTGSNVIGNIYDGSINTFDIQNLNQLAQAAGFAHMADMVTKAKNGTVKTAADFGGTTVIFGTQVAFEFIPVYLSKSTGGEAILTLYLATADGFTTYMGNGTCSTNATLPASAYNPNQFSVLDYTVSGAPVRSTSYDVSGLRTRVLNGWDVQLIEWNKYNGQSSVARPVPDVSTFSRYAPFRSDGIFSEYLVAPSEIPWQMAENGANDPSGTDSSFPTQWISDSLWIPSTKEVQDGGIWGMNATQRADGTETFLRTQGGSYVDWMDYISPSGGLSSYNNDVAFTLRGVRFAVHLNLSKLNIVLTPKITGTYTYTRAEQTVSFDQNFDTNKMEIVGITHTDGTAFDAPTFTATVAKFTDAGEYEITLKSKPINAQTTDCWLFSDTGTDTTKIKFKVAKAKLQQLSFGAGSANSKEYNGTTQKFMTSDYPSTSVPDPNGILPSLYPRDPLSFVITKTDGAMIGGVNPVGTPTASGGLEVEVRNAGKYKATFTIADAVNYEWWDGSTGTKDALFEIRPKELGVSDNNANGWSWTADQSTETRTITVSGLYNGDGNTVPADSVDLQLKITDATTNASSLLAGTNNNDGTYTFVIDKNISVFGGNYSVGSFYVAPVLGGGAGGTHDGNYSFKNALASLNGGKGYHLVISPAGAGLSSYDLVYSSDDGDSNVAMPNGKVQFKYKQGTTTAAAYTVTMESTQLTAANLQVDTTYNQNGFVNGYKNNAASTAGNYTGYVRLHSTDPNSLFNGTDTDADIAFSFEIEKANFQFGNLKWRYTDANSSVSKDYPAQWNATTGAWEYDDGNGNFAAGNPDPGLPWLGWDYTLTLSGLPTGITVNPTGYTGNVKKTIGTYLAECNITYDTANFNAPDAALLRLDWSIVKGQVIINIGSWSSQSQGTGSNIFYVPTLQNVSGVDYEYYDLGTDANPISAPGTKLNGISDLTSVSGTTHHYYVKAVVKSGFSLDGVTLWTDAIEIVDKTGGGVHGSTGANLGDCTKYFYTGDSRTPVQVALNGAPYVYDKQPHGVLDDGTNNGELEITVGNNVFPASNFTINYYERDTANAADHNKGNQLAGAPVDAGWYVIEVQLTQTAGSAYYATDEYFEFEIKPFVLDMSQVKWGYLDENGNEIAYNPSLPLQYTLDANGNAVTHTLVLIGLPKGDANGDAAAQLLAQMFADSGLDVNGANPIISYRDNTSSQVTNNGTMTAVCEIDTNMLSKNFTLGSMPFQPDANGIATSTQAWTIEPKKINAPKSDATHEFTGQTLDILSFAGLDPAELGVYYKLTGLTKRDQQNNAQTLFTSATCADPNNPTLDEVKAILAGIKDAGRYGITVEIIDKANVKFVENGVIGTLPTYSAQITVNKLKIQIVDWQGDGNSPWHPSYASNNYPSNIVEDKFTDMSGNAVTAAELVNRYNEQFRQTIGAIAGNEENVEIEFLTGVDSEKTFFMLDMSNPPDPIAKPTSPTPPNSTFTGSDQNFLPSDLESMVDSGKVKLYAVDENGKETEVDKSYFTQKNAGKYKVIARVNGNYYWTGTTYDQTPLEYEFEIGKAEIKGEWTTDENGRQTLNVPAEFKDMIEYEYRDKNNKVVPVDKLKKGSTYSVSAKIKESEKQNADLLAEDENGNWNPAETLGSEFKMPGSEGLFGGLLPEDFPLWQIIVSVISLILFIIFMILTAKNRKEKKEAEEEIRKYQEDMAQADDE